MTKDALFEMFDRYDTYETLETGETVQVIHWHDLKHIAEEIVKNCSIPDVVGRSEQLKAVEKLKDFAYEVCPLHREDDLEEIVGSL